uniref:Uncharacterized protein n=1 Tax=Octopus bimaculoides TaxID=37653 RepID=A0A0L8H6U6_OCTBM
MYSLKNVKVIKKYYFLERNIIFPYAHSIFSNRRMGFKRSLGYRYFKCSKESFNLI